MCETEKSQGRATNMNDLGDPQATSANHELTFDYEYYHTAGIYNQRESALHLRTDFRSEVYIRRHLTEFKGRSKSS
jgi:hypothetical protein